MSGDILQRVRKNHGLEHACVWVLLKGGMRPPLGGYSTAGGFFIFGKASLDVVTNAAHEALELLRSGQRQIAISPHCGTNLVTGAVLAGVLSGALMRRRERRPRRFAAATAGIIAATLVSRPLGNALQRLITTLSDVDDVEITEVQRVWGGPYPLYRVHTRSRVQQLTGAA